MQLHVALSLLAYITTISAQDIGDKEVRHVHHRRAPNPTTLIAKVAKAVPTLEADPATIANARIDTKSTKTIKTTTTSAEEEEPEITEAEETSDDSKHPEDADDAEETAAKVTATAALNVNINAAKKAKSSDGGAKPKTHKTNLPPATVTGQPYLTKAHAAIARMQTFYNSPRQGFWTEGWWNSANAYTLLADLRSRDSSAFIRKITDGPNGVFAHSPASMNKNRWGGLAWDDWYDDMMWWAIGLTKAYDVTGNKHYLDVARGTWQRVQAQARNAVCGGLYNADVGVKGRGQSTIATLLYVEVTAMFAKRYPQDRAYFLNLAKGEWNWVMKNIFQYNYIRGDGQKKDPRTGQCTNNGAILSYIEGTAINAAVALNAVTGDYSYLDIANTIAIKSLMDKGLNRSGILHDTCDQNFGCNPDEAQFKGIFMRGLRNLYEVQPSAANGVIPQFLKQNADSIWKNSRASNNLLGQKWDGPFNSAGPDIALAQHSSATMALVAAALL